MSVLPSDEQILLRESTRQFLTSTFPIDRVRTFIAASEEEKRNIHRAFWQSIAELGWLGILWDEESGGIGLGCVEAGIIFEELGRALVPSAYLPTLLSAVLVERCLPQEQSREWLNAVSAGELALSLTIEDPLGRNDPFGPCRAKALGERFSLTGRKEFVPQAKDVDRILVAGSLASGETAWFWVDAKGPGVDVRERETMDATRPLYSVSFDEAEAHALGSPEAAFVLGIGSRPSTGPPWPPSPRVDPSVSSRTPWPMPRSACSSMSRLARSKRSNTSVPTFSYPWRGHVRSLPEPCGHSMRAIRKPPSSVPWPRRMRPRPIGM